MTSTADKNRETNSGLFIHIIAYSPEYISYFFIPLVQET